MRRVRKAVSKHNGCRNKDGKHSQVAARNQYEHSQQCSHGRICKNQYPHRHVLISEPEERRSINGAGRERPGGFEEAAVWTLVVVLEGLHNKHDAWSALQGFRFIRFVIVRKQSKNNKMQSREEGLSLPARQAVLFSYGGSMAWFSDFSLFLDPVFPKVPNDYHLRGRQLFRFSQLLGW